jgi:hypothetical protein
MNVYQRPLFRQAGGPVAPGMAGMEAVMGQGQMEGAAAGQLLQQSEQAMAQEMQGVGAQYADTLMSTLDQAEDFKSVIDALRGNEVPIQQRYAELAQYVGEEDAQATPESVLAMVQPTIMLTEEGAMDSGIGDLMRQISSEVDMELPSGEPTPAGQGVGSLMAAGQPVQQFNRGGAVARFRNGGVALPTMQAPQFTGLPTMDGNLQQTYENRLGTYQRALGIDPAQQRDAAQSRILFDIASRGLAFASGVDPRTGENVAGRPMGAQLAGAFQTLPLTISEELRAQQEREQGIKLAALQSAEQSEQAMREQTGRERLQGMQSATQFAMQISNQDFTRGENMTNREHETTLVDRRGQIQTALQELQGAQSMDQIEARGQLQKQLSKLDNQLQIARMGVQHENNLSMLGAKTEADLTLMNNDYDRKSALQNTSLAAQAEENALDRTLKTTMQNKDLGVRQAMQQAQFENSRELQSLEQQFKAGESQKDRDLRMEIQTRTERQARLDRDLRVAIQENDIEAQKALQTERLDNATALQDARLEFQQGENAEDRALRSDILDRQIQQQVFDRMQQDKQFQTTSDLEAYSLAIKEQQARYTQLGSSMDARMTSLLSDPKLQQKYMNGTATPSERQLFEMSALSLSQPETVFDPKTQTYVTKAGQKLTPDMMRALQANPEVYGQITANLGIAGRGEKPGAEGALQGGYAERYPNRAALGLPEPPPGIDVPDINPAGLTTKNIDYSSAFGPMFTIDNIANTVSDLFGRRLPSPEAEQARNYFVALREKLVGLADANIEGRPSNFQIEIQQSLLPEVGNILNGDQAALEKIDKLKDKVSSELTQKAESFNMGGLSEQQAQDIRRQYNYISYILAELNEVKRGMSAGIQADRPPVSSFITPIQ